MEKGADTAFAFVLMPFSADFDDVYRLGIKRCAEELGIVAERVDEQHFSETILEQIYRQIDASDLIIADMTDQNPNVFYEVGYAHAKGKPCALITQRASDIPFDLKHHTHVIYNGRIVDLVEKLKPKMAWLIEEVQKKKRAAFSLDVRSGTGYLEKFDQFHKGSFDLELIIRNTFERRGPEIEAIHVITNRKWHLSENDVDLPFDDCHSKEGKELRKHLVNPSLRRLPPEGFLKSNLKFRRTFWTRWNGKEMRDSYKSKGNIEFEIATEDGIQRFDVFLEVDFDEIPF